MYNDPDHLHLETATHLIGHCLREVESAVRALLLPQWYRPPNKSSQKKAGAAPTNVSAGNAEPSTPVSPSAPGIHEAQVYAVLAEYGISLDTDVARAWLELTDRSLDRGLHRMAHRINLEHPRALDDDYQLQYEKTLMFLEGVTASFEERFADLVKAVEPVLRHEVPTTAHLKLLSEKVPNNPATLHYLFSKIDHVGWLEALWHGGFFKRPPGTSTNRSGGQLQYVPWPQADLLLRLAAAKPALTVEIICNTQTSNPAIVVNFLQALLTLSVGEAAKAAEPVLDWAENIPEVRDNMFFPDFIAVFARAGEISAAVTLARLLLTPVPDDASDAGGRYDRGRAALIFGHHLSALREASPEAHYEVVVEVFKRLVGFGPASGSSWYRPSVAPHINGVNMEFRDVVLDATRDSAEQLIARHPEKAPDIIRDLWAHGWPMSRRLAIHLAASATDLPLGEAEVLLSATTLTNPELEPEILALLGSVFPRLSSTAQNTLLEAVERGPDWMRGKTPPEDDLRYWQHRYLSAIRTALTGKRLTWANRLLGEFGPYDRDASHFTSVFVGPSSPYSPDELARWDADGVLEMLGSWQDTSLEKDWARRPTVAGLARAAQQRFEAEPEAFTARAAQFLTLHPAYTDALLMALRTAVDRAHPFDWRPVLELCIAGHRLSRPSPHRSWNVVRRSLAVLLDAGFKSRTHPLPWSLRSLAWEALVPLTEDPNPEPSDEASLSDEWQQLIGRSINSTRSLSLMSVIGYARWVRTHQSELQAQSGFDQIPEVRRVLDDHLDPKREPSLAVRAVYGMDLALLFSLDPGWTRERLHQIFPAGHADLQRAAWTGYLERSGIILELSSALEPYDQAIKALRTEDTFLRDSAQDHLVRHLMVMLLWSEWSTKLPDQRLASFFDQASPALRQAALRWVAQLLEYSEESDDVLERARALFSWRLSLAKLTSGADREAFGTELEGLGAWVRIKGLGGNWFLDALQEVLTVAGRVEHVDEVARTLPELADITPERALASLESLVPQLTAYRLEKFGRPVVALALTDEHAREAARAYIRDRALEGDYSLMDMLDDAPN